MLKSVSLPSTKRVVVSAERFASNIRDISNKMVGDKCADIMATGANTLPAGDMGCLLNIAGKLKQEGSPVEVRHVAEVLAGMTDTPSIGEGK